ncbi:MAG: pyridoxal-phosphate dependent enzyme [Nitriliruptoraceae bacterium]|nr:pyridoxal-phosphate dependent enzyme [Nitriliruptoraceae bacterium]
MNTLPIDADAVARAADRLAGVAHRTPVLRSATLDRCTGAQVVCKAEHLQRIGAFKFRGGYNALAALPVDVRARGVVAFSSGNHAQAVAAAARMLDVSATIVMPDDAPAVKVEATIGYGAEVVRYDRYTQDRAAIGARLADERGATVIPPYDDPEVMAGQGTVASELLDEVGALDVLVVPVGGGGLIGGCAVAAAAHRGATRIIGVEPAGRRAARDALARGEVVEVPVPQTVLDGQQTPNVGTRPLAVMQALVDEVVGVSDAEVAVAMRFAALRMKQFLEPSGASALAAVLAGHLDVAGQRVGIVCSGGNVAPERFAALVGTAADVADPGVHHRDR